MKVIVVFDFPEINDSSSFDADFIIETLSDDLDEFCRIGEYDWYLDDVIQ